MLPTNRQKISPLHYGLDIGGTKIEIGIFNSELTMLESWRIETPTQNYDEFLDAIHGLIKQADELSGQRGSIGIGMPGIIDNENKVKSANVPCATGKFIVQDLQKRVGREISIANDCRLFALSESYGGAGDNQPVVYGAIIGTGAGGGLCINGKLLQTANNIAGEYGHIAASGKLLQQYNLPVRDCGCGLRGCIESYIAGPGLGWLYKFFGASTESTTEFVEQLRKENPIAQKTFDCYMDLLGSSFASLVLYYDPNAIVVGGGLSKIDEIIQALPKAIEQHLFKGVTSPLIKRAVFGDASGVRGAAILGKQHDIT
ncbi:ROK family protein [Thalassotalea sp. ND16A]|uniref:ROK family protein n=1 Tax=Thalassotalea sp. ND16A TaxID=1535422 RepID=UPI00051CC0EF|nr:ROK family protein [Thalassotalea sp. ND16A]KGJ88680.1 N-acetylglucosamine kinase [Thalassotalea sp. ND16A]